MNLDQMHFFTVVAQMENVSKAADSLHMTQSTLSKNILRLEEELGVPLFDRHGKKLFLNEQGSRFLDTCRKTLQDVSEAKE
ncbi:MAG: LysR family transcriptional regulator, partial [Lachnospiraceae bacterium]|nr:LysR family transcriptional regulator [Lachnospiraceae bacterium]